jgi:hypothetical protein
MNNQLQIQLPNNFANAGLQLSKIQVNAEYMKEWNERLRDFVVLTMNGELLRPTLYRIGGLNNPKLGVDKYFMLIKHVEAVYDLEFCKRVHPEKSNKQLEEGRKHLESRWCIIDEKGNELVEFDSFKIPYLTKDSCIYSIDSNYYNIETGEHYGRCSSSWSSRDFLFLDIHNFKDSSKNGIMKIHKKDGSWELFPK